ncbi:rhotekin-2 [Protopterus annectens]|uniref:rhotekin-2 n=1 Tax=Protopterus annectens TaxID=7888 RepID=UPI001CF9B5BA|nr:rhotekin-2 [Protopterus annectens]
MAESSGRRDFQMFSRTEKTRATIAQCASLAMELKRKKVRASTVFQDLDSNISESVIDIKLFTRNVQLKLEFGGYTSSVEQFTFKKPSIYTPVMHPLLDAFTKMVEDDLHKLDHENRQRRWFGNLSPKLRTALNRLGNDTSIVLRPADKGGPIVIMDTVQYEHSMVNMLSETRFYSLVHLDEVRLRVDRIYRMSSDIGSKERKACRGKVAISDIRIPLMWKDCDHFSNKGRSQQFAVFCMFKIGTEICDTEMAVVDKTVTDICFDTVAVFNEAGPEFELKLEVYSCCFDEDSPMINTPKKLVKKLGASLGKSSGKKLVSQLDGAEAESFFLPSTMASASKYHLLAHTTLSLESVESGFRTHSLNILGNEESSFWLPLYGNLCCRLVAQPVCMTEDVMGGFLDHQEMVGDLLTWSTFYCVLRGSNLLCYYTPEEIEAKVEPAFKIPVNKDTRIRTASKDLNKRANSLSIVNPLADKAITHVFAAAGKDELQKWMEAFWQHFYDFSQWKHCCNELMKIEMMSPRKPPLFLTKEATSVYHDMSIGSPMKCESLCDIIHNKMEETDGQFHSTQDKSVSPQWEDLFDKVHSVAVQKTILSPDESSYGGKAKKRRASLPPSGKTMYRTEIQASINQAQKENMCNNVDSSLKMFSFENKLTSLMRQLQRPVVTPQESAVKGSSGNSSNSPPACSELELPGKPIPAQRQRRKSIREKLNPKLWLSSHI